MRLSKRLRRWLKSVLPSTFIVLVAGLFVCPGVALARDLTFAQRVEAQRAIERVYFIHRSGGARGFDASVPEALLVEKVRTYLTKSVALEEFWNTPVTATMLRREVERMTAGSRLPERLAEIRAALGNDDRLLAETLARETLVDRLCRSFLAADTRMATRDWDTWWAEMAPRFDPYRARTVVEESTVHGMPAANGGVSPDAAACTLQDIWGAGHDDTTPRNRILDAMVWTGSEVIIWSGQGSRYDPATDSWSPTQTLGAPSGRYYHRAVWTGTEMIVWGGLDNFSNQPLNTGGRYDPVADTWTPTSTIDAPPPTAEHVAVWTGTQMIVWSGESQSNRGGRYDPATDTWEPTSLAGAPDGRSSATAVWTGTQMIVWGGTSTGGGGRYDPVTDVWSPVTQLNAPHSYLIGNSAVWTGSRMLIWGGCEAGFATNSGLYDPVSDTWLPVTSAGAPSNRCYHAAVWTGSEMIVWGGMEFVTSYPQPDLNTGGRYNPATDSWQPISAINTPAASAPAKAVWSGSLMIAFGGTTLNGGRYRLATDSWTPTLSAQHFPSRSAQPASVWTGAELIVWSGPGANDSGRYDPTTDSWKSVKTTGAPSLRSGETAVWVGGWMVIWGGEFNGTPLDTGGRYSPLADTWDFMPEDDIPAARVGHTAIRAGSKMIVWGGQGAGGMLADGALYNPSLNLWTPIPPDGAPAPRRDHAAVWTSHEMVIWGGDVGGGVGTDTGGRFNPTANAGAGGWVETSTSGAPSARAGPTGVWTGSRMIVWGGGSDSSGGQYDPAADAWTPTAISGAPAPRAAHTSVWSGSQMIVWGGALSTPQSFTTLSTGGVYDPLADVWMPTTSVAAPSARFNQAAAWTGRAMLVWGGSVGIGGAPVNDRIMHWYGSASAAPPADLDGDGVLSCQDCDDGNPAVWGIPGEATGLLFNDDDVTLVWSPPSFSGADAVSYDLLRSGTASDFLSAGICLESGSSNPTAVDADTPSVNEFFFYLARARNACPGGVGTVGAGSSGVPRAALVCP